MKTATIGNGLYARTPLTWMDRYLQKQAACKHQQRDPKGTCYTCGHKEVK